MLRNSLLAILAAVTLTGAHGHHDVEEETQEPLVGWTKDDLDAKWGTDVRAEQCYWKSEL